MIEIKYKGNLDKKKFLGELVEHFPSLKGENNVKFETTENGHPKVCFRIDENEKEIMKLIQKNLVSHPQNEDIPQIEEEKISKKKRRFSFTELMERELEQAMDEFYEKLDEMIAKGEKQNENLTQMAQGYEIKAKEKLMEMDSVIDEKFVSQKKTIDETTLDIRETLANGLKGINEALAILGAWKRDLEGKFERMKEIW